MNKYIRSLLIFIIITAFSSVSAYAILTNLVTSSGNTLTAGTVVLYADTNANTPGIQINNLFDLSNLIPGSSATRNLLIVNGGSLGLSYNGAVVKASGDNALFSALNLRVGVVATGQILYDGTLNNYTGFTTSRRHLNTSTNEELFFTLTLPENVSANLQGKLLGLTFTFEASQAP